MRIYILQGVIVLRMRLHLSLIFVQKIHHMGPATDFYKKLSLDCSAQQIAVDLFMLNSQYSDIASVGKSGDICV